MAMRDGSQRTRNVEGERKRERERVMGSKKKMKFVHSLSVLEHKLRALTELEKEQKKET